MPDDVAMVINLFMLTRVERIVFFCVHSDNTKPSDKHRLINGPRGPSDTKLGCLCFAGSPARSPAPIRTTGL